MGRGTINVSPKLWEVVREIAHKEKRSQAAVVQDGISLYLASLKSNESSAQIGAPTGPSGPSGDTYSSAALNYLPIIEAVLSGSSGTSGEMAKLALRMLRKAAEMVGHGKAETGQVPSAPREPAGTDGSPGDAPNGAGSSSHPGTPRKRASGGR